jgi:outer membrane protein assembly factor BamB
LRTNARKRLADILRTVTSTFVIVVITLADRILRDFTFRQHSELCRAAGLQIVGDHLMRKPLSVAGLLVIFMLQSSATWSGPTVYPTGLTIHKKDLVYPGYTIYTASSQKRVILLNMKGQEVHSWTNPYGGHLAIAENPKPFNDGSILVQLRHEDVVDSSGNVVKQKSVAKLDWNGNLIWEFFDPNFSFLHHDFHRKPNGNTIILGSERISDPSIAPYEFKDDILIEVDKGGKVVWRWSTAEHFDELGISERGKQAIYDNEYPSLNQDADIFHTNSVQALPGNKWMDTDPRFKKHNILVSQRSTNKVFIIDYPSGDIVWRLDQVAGFPNGNDRTIGQHHVTMLPRKNLEGLPLKGAGNILIFDNGGHGGYPRQYRFQSRVLLINPRSGKVVWQYDAEDSGIFIKNFFSMFKSSAQRLPNGNTLITESTWGRIFEVRPKGKIVWEYVNPYFKNKQKGDHAKGRQNHIYRAYRVSLDWPPDHAGL